jgi:hypothetical protein
MTWDKDDPERRVEPLMPGQELEPRDPPILRVGARFEHHDDIEIAPLIALAEPGLGERKPLISTLKRLIEHTALLISACAEGETWGRASTADGIGVLPPS